MKLRWSSPQALILKWALKYNQRFWKNRTNVPVEAARARLDGFGEKLPPTPDWVKIDDVVIDGVAARWVDATDRDTDEVIFYLHGGGYVGCSPPGTHRDLLWRLSAATGRRVLALNYRKAPEHPFPAALDDAVAAYCWLLERCSAQSIVIAGDSAGGGLALACSLKLKALAMPLPAAQVLLSPWTDLAGTGESTRSNAQRDTMIPCHMLDQTAALYLANADPKDPYASPLYADLQGLQPTLIQVSADEALRDDGVRVARKMQRQGVSVDLKVWGGVPHAWPLFARFLPEGRRALEEITQFLGAHGQQAELVKSSFYASGRAALRRDADRKPV